MLENIVYNCLNIEWVDIIVVRKLGVSLVVFVECNGGMGVCVNFDLLIEIFGIFFWCLCCLDEICYILCYGV